MLWINLGFYILLQEIPFVTHLQVISCIPYFFQLENNKFCFIEKMLKNVEFHIFDKISLLLILSKCLQFVEQVFIKHIIVSFIN